MITETNKKWIALGCILLSVAVALGAFGAHALKDRMSDHYLAIYKTGNLYHFIHALGLLIMSIILSVSARPQLQIVAGLLTTGILLFSGSLYILSFNEIWQLPQLKILGAITPLGGLLFIAGWLAAAYFILSSSDDPASSKK